MRILRGLACITVWGTVLAVPKDQKKWQRDTIYSNKHITDIGGRMYIEGEMYRTVCTCRPSKPTFMSSCFPAKVEIQHNGVFPGSIDPNRLIIDPTNLRRLIGDPSQLRLVPVKRQYFSDVDGRSSDEVAGLWGGDFGELVLGMAVIEKNQGPQIEFMMKQYVKRFLKSRAAPYFYFMTDTLGVAYMEQELGVENLDPTRPPPALHARVLELLERPQAHGSGWLRQVLEQPQAFGVRLGMVVNVMRELFKVMWDPHEPLGRKIKFYVLHAESVRAESAFVEFRTRGACLDEGMTVLFPPFSNDVSIFVHSPAAVEAYHNATSRVVKAQLGGTVNAEDMAVELATLYAQWHGVMPGRLEHLAGLPKYIVYVDALDPTEEAELMHTAPPTGEVGKSAADGLKLNKEGQLNPGESAEDLQAVKL